MTLRHIGLFEGIGGFSLAARWMAWETIAWCEWNEFGQRVLKYHFPKAEGHGDITTTDFRPYRGKCDILTGGFPCQPYSSAGKRLGKEDDRHLWPEMLRAVREVRPKWVVGENVLGIVNWNGGLVFDEVQVDLEAEGYEVQPYVLPACAVNAPHRRDRTWFVAFNPNSPTSGKGTYLGGKDGRGISETSKKGVFQEKNDKCTGFGEVPPKEGTFTNTDKKGLQGRKEKGIAGKSGKKRNEQFTGCLQSKWEEFPTQSPIRSRNDGFSRQLVRYISKELQYEISNTSKENRIENLPEVWKKVQQEEIWQKIRRLYSLESKKILLETMQLYSTNSNRQVKLSPFSEKVSQKPLRILQKHGEFRCTPQGRKLEKQRKKEYSDSLSFLPHEVALAARRYTRAMAEFETWHRNESIKAYGNAIVPAVAYQIFKSIEKYEELCNKKQV